MIEKSFKKIQERINNNEKLTLSQKKELLNMLDELQNNIQDVEKIDGRAAQSLAAAMADNGVRSVRGSELIGEFEVKYPLVTQTINRICIMLSDIGI
ncbi:MAG: hypothetical protein MST10_05805 [Lentisphaeria bacterium]|nr:hypothetical protein [Lentisphaeria bacterium]